MVTCISRVLLCWLIGIAAVPTPATAAPRSAPALMLARSYGGEPVGLYWISEKLDGVRGRWDGKRLSTRAGHPIAAPSWFTTGWPPVPMDGELWMGRGRFDQTSALVRTGDPAARGWTRVRFMIFDLPGHGGRFGQRVQAMQALAHSARVPWLQPVPQFRIHDASSLDQRLLQVVEGGGEGLMLHHRDALYRGGRSDHLLKLKPHEDAEARVVGYTPGKGKYEGMLGALIVELADGRRMKLGSGLGDALRARPPAVGTLVTYRYNGLTSTGLPRFARFMRVRHEPAPPDPR